MSTIRIGIVGHGNLGRGVEAAVGRNADMEVAAIFTRRDPASVTPVVDGTPVHALAEVDAHAGAVDVLILCGGSKQDLPEQTPALARRFNVVDSFDTHARIPEHFAAVDDAARAGGTLALISAGWDPGLFSVNRVMAEAVLPDGATHTFWGPGLSQGHSDAIRRIPGVAGAVQYTIPREEAVEKVRTGERVEFTARQKHLRDCYVVLEDGANLAAVRDAIVTMPHYFDEYDTAVTFISAEELARDHAGMPHGGFVVRSGETSDGVAQVVEYRLALESNPEFTSSVLVAYARAVARMSAAGEVGARTVFDVAPGLLSPASAEDLRARYL